MIVERSSLGLLAGERETGLGFDPRASPINFEFRVNSTRTRTRRYFQWSQRVPVLREVGAISAQDACVKDVCVCGCACGVCLLWRVLLKNFLNLLDLLNLCPI